ncbi:tyrosine-type recombinase/integrase [Mesorhizobium sp. VNQ89]|uniref:site-specific integrase n=1 Tax=Mesorhizobium quangtriensis TaxID=3157709 RepID=UPI0032B74326
MRKRNAKNERIKRQYLVFLEEAKQLSVTSADQALAAILAFEESTGYKDFAQFHIEQARRFKRVLSDTVNASTGKPLAKATIHSRLMAVKAFFQWLAPQQGYRRIKYPDAEYFNPSANDLRASSAKRERPAPDLAQVHRAIDAMPCQTAIEKRDRAVMAFALLSGARDDALASFRLKHVDLDQRTVFQDGREVRTKFRKSFTTWFFPVGGNAEAIVREWIAYLRDECGFGVEDPLFPPSRVGQNADGLFAVQGLDRTPWSDAGPIRAIFKQAFVAVDLPNFHPHSLRTTIARLGLTLCTAEEQWSTWSLNLGHENVATTFKSYATVPTHRRAEIMRTIGTPASPANLSQEEIALLERLVSDARRGAAEPAGS